MTRSIHYVVIAMLGSFALGAAADTVAWHPAQWNFDVTLDDRPIGRHRFDLERVSGRNDEWQLSGAADYDVRVLGFSVYTYHHSVKEQWREGCLASLSATTDDDDNSTSVEVSRAGDALRIDVSKGVSTQTRSVSGCIMTFAYWNPAMRSQSRLLNPQTGVLEAVTIRLLGKGKVRVGGQEIDAEDWHLQTPDGPVDVWYTTDGNWIGLDAIVSGHRNLRYRLP